MKIRFYLTGTFLMVAVAGCSGPNSAARNLETAASINSLAGVPFSGAVGLVASAADVISRVGSPKIGKTSDRLDALVAKTPSIFCDSNGNCKWAEYFVWRENGEVKRIKTDQIPREMLNYKAAWAKAVGLIPQGVFSEENHEMQARNLEAWEKGGTVVAEYLGQNGAKIVAVSKNNEPFALMLPEEWADKAQTLK